MGVFSVKTRVWNPLNPKLSRDVKLLVDTRATYTVLPEDLLKGLGIKGAETLDYNTPYHGASFYAFQSYWVC